MNLKENNRPIERKNVKNFKNELCKHCEAFAQPFHFAWLCNVLNFFSERRFPREKKSIPIV